METQTEYIHIGRLILWKNLGRSEELKWLDWETKEGSWAGFSLIPCAYWVAGNTLHGTSLPSYLNKNLMDRIWRPSWAEMHPPNGSLVCDTSFPGSRIASWHGGLRKGHNTNTQRVLWFTGWIVERKRQLNQVIRLVYATLVLHILIFGRTIQ